MGILRNQSTFLLIVETKVRGGFPSTNTMPSLFGCFYAWLVLGKAVGAYLLFLLNVLGHSDGGDKERCRCLLLEISRFATLTHLVDCAVAVRTPS